MIKQIHGRTFLELTLLDVNQKGKRFYLAKAPAKHFTSMYSVNPAKYQFQEQAAVAAQVGTDEEYLKALRTRISDVDKSDGFQRELDTTRKKEVQSYLLTEEYALFPNAIICTASLANDLLGISSLAEYEAYVRESATGTLLSFLDEQGATPTLLVPVATDSILVIDGQHRLAGLHGVGSIVTDDYDLIVTFILGFDRSVIARLFYTINYTQKSVNKSLLYQLMGEFTREIDETAFLHETVVILNELEKSPFFGRIKMLGKVPNDHPEHLHGLATLSQAFLIDALMPLIESGNSNSAFQPVLRPLFLNEKKQIAIVRTIIRYFQAVRSQVPTQWQAPNTSIVSKTIAVGALMGVFQLLLAQKLLEFHGDYKKLEELSERDFADMLTGLDSVDFSSDGPFGKIGSGGASTKIRTAVLKSIKAFKGFEADVDSSFRTSKLKDVKDYLS